MADFDKAYQLTMGHEGGYANDPDDKGGETYKGIARKHNPNWAGWLIIDDIKWSVGRSASAINKHAAGMENLQLMVRTVYMNNYWDVLKLDAVEDQEIANALFDVSVNMGWRVAGRFLQEALNLCNKNQQSYPDIVVDGIVGSKTLFALERANDRVIYNTINLLKGERYIEIMRSNKSQEKFWAGWLKRVLLK